MLAKDITIIKMNNYTYEQNVPNQNEEVIAHCTDTIIKRGRIHYSYSEKFKLGFITPQEYYYWQQELFEEEQKTKALEDKKKSSKNRTFWEDDEAVRENVSNSDYDKFLRENGLNVSNTTAVDIGAIIQEENQKALDSIGFATTQNGIDDILESASEEELQAQALAMVNAGKDDENRVLTPEEIAALFAEAGV